MWSSFQTDRETCAETAMKNGRCRMHGGKATGAPNGNRNAWKHGKLFVARESKANPDPNAVGEVRGRAYGAPSKDGSETLGPMPSWKLNQHP